jgi:glycine C-acetyltransferase
MIERFADFLHNELKVAKERGLYFEKRILESEQSHKVTLNGRSMIMLCSNNYLGLATHPRVRRAAKAAIDKYGVGLGCGRHACSILPQIELETKLARFKKTEAAITFQTGYDANLGAIMALTGKDDVIISDELNHGSIIDGCRLTKAEKKVYPHKDVETLEKLLTQSREARRIFVITDGVFSMGGDIAPLPEIVELCEEHSALAYVDDAHACGVLGKNGEGTVDHFGLHGKVAIQMGSLSKALACVGGYIASRHEIADYLWQYSRPFGFATGHLPPPVAAAISAMIDVLEDEPQHLQNLWRNTRFFKGELEKLGFNTGQSQTPITPVILGESTIARTFSDRLFGHGIYVQAYGYPVVPEGEARLRTIVSATHTSNELTCALEIFEKTGNELGLL